MIILIIRAYAHESENVYPNFNKSKENLEICPYHLNGILNKKKTFLITMFVLITSGKSELYIYLTFL